jgi:hypothetical protein
MSKSLSSMLLGGALLMVAAIAIQLTAQEPGQGAAKSQLEVAFSYNAANSNQLGGKTFWMQGGTVQLHGRFYRGLGVVAEIGGLHAANINGGGVSLDLVTATFGPRYTWSRAYTQYAFFGQVLTGEAFGFDSFFPKNGGATENQNSLALELGGGMNWAVSPHLAIRTFEADWLRTHLPNSANNVQNNLRVGAAVILRFP